MKAKTHSAELDKPTKEFYREVLVVLTEAEIPFLIGGAYALAEYTGIVRHTKDLDLFLAPKEVGGALAALSRRGWKTEMTDSLWIAKVFSQEGAFVDLIFRSGNGVSEVDEDWFRHSSQSVLLGVPVGLCSPEETLWSKAFIMERERYDGADVAHYILAWAHCMDWERLISRFGSHWRVLLSHLILFGFAFPSHRNLIPDAVLRLLLDRLNDEIGTPAPKDKICQGTLLSRVFYLVDVGPRGYQDARFERRGTLTEEDISQWRETAVNQAPTLLKEAGISLDETRKLGSGTQRPSDAFR